MNNTKNERAVIITTEYRGVFFGYTDDTSGDVVHLRSARCALYWSKDIGGFLGLAEVGPNGNCRIGKRADIELRRVTSVVEVTPAAVKAWESAS
jgi:hypothetical protein